VEELHKPKDDTHLIKLRRQLITSGFITAITKIKIIIITIVIRIDTITSRMIL
jgi:hypothetical protein